MAALPPRKRPGTHCIEGLVGPTTSLDGCGKFRPHREFFLFWCSLYFIRTCFFHLTVLHFAFSLYLYNRNIHAPGGIILISPPLGFLLFSLRSLSVLLCSDCPGLRLLSLLCNTTQTAMPPAGLEPATPASDRPQTLALDHSTTGIGRIRYPDRPGRSESLYRQSCTRPPSVRQWTELSSQLHNSPLLCRGMGPRYTPERTEGPQCLPCRKIPVPESMTSLKRGVIDAVLQATARY